MSVQRKSNKKGSLRDLCQSPRYALDPIKTLLKREVLVWECAAGEGNLSLAMEFDYGISVIKSDISTGTDFLKIPTPLGRPLTIVTNPPFSLVKEFTNHALHLRKIDRRMKVAFLMPSQVVSTKWFQEVTQFYGQPGIVWFNPRIDFKMPNKGWEGKGSHFPTAWFTWGWFEGNNFVRMDHWTKEYKENNR